MASKLYKIQQIAVVLSELKRLDDRIPFISILNNLDSSKENQGYTLVEVSKAFDEALQTDALVDGKGKKRSITRNDLVPMPYSLEDLFGIFGKHMTTREKIIFLYEDRLKRGIIRNKTDLANRAGVAKSYVTALFSGDYEMIGDTKIDQFAKAFDVPRVFLEDNSSSYLIEKVYKEAKKAVREEGKVLSDSQRMDDYILEYYPEVFYFLHFLRFRGYEVSYKVLIFDPDLADRVKAIESKEINAAIDRLIKNHNTSLKEALSKKKRYEAAIESGDKEKSEELLADISILENDCMEEKANLYRYCQINKVLKHTMKSVQNEYIEKMNPADLKKGEKLAKLREDCVKYIVDSKLPSAQMKYFLSAPKRMNKIQGCTLSVEIKGNSKDKVIEIGDFEKYVESIGNNVDSMLMI